MPNMNNTDYLSTLMRMYKDSRLLYQEEEYYNSCYLSGYVLECALKYILLTYGKNQNGIEYTLDDMKTLAHNTSKLNQHLNDWISMTGGIASKYRLDCDRICRNIYIGCGGYPKWDPKYRYGEHPQWNEAIYCGKYMEEIDNIFHFIANIVVGGD